MNLRSLALAAAAIVLLVACTRAPYTRRVQYNLVPDGVMSMLGSSTYKTMLGEARVERGTENARLLGRVGRRIAGAAKKPEYDWEYALMRDETINAWCLPGGKIGFYTGILPVLQSEAGMAFVMGHEVGHATAHHGAERLSQQLSLLGGLTGLDLFLANSSRLTREQRGLIMGAIGLGAEVGVILPFSRKHESEADIIGMMYMANAGYPPAESIEVWKRMDRLAGGGGPAFLSTHPSNARRQENLREWLPRARKRFERNKLDHDTREALWGSGGDRDDRGDDREGRDRSGGVSKPRR